MSQCTHVIVFSGMDGIITLPEEMDQYKHVRVVSEAWIEKCFCERALVDDTPFLLRPNSDETGMFLSLHLLSSDLDDFISYHAPNTQYIFEWESSMKESVNKLFEGVSSECHTILSVRLRWFRGFSYV